MSSLQTQLEQSRLQEAELLGALKEMQDKVLDLEKVGLQTEILSVWEKRECEQRQQAWICECVKNYFTVNFTMERAHFRRQAFGFTSWGVRTQQLFLLLMFYCNVKVKARKGKYVSVSLFLYNFFWYSWTSWFLVTFTAPWSLLASRCEALTFVDPLTYPLAAGTGLLLWHWPKCLHNYSIW